jgi:hypothetical protein
MIELTGTVVNYTPKGGVKFDKKTKCPTMLVRLSKQYKLDEYKDIGAFQFPNSKDDAVYLNLRIHSKCKISGLVLSTDIVFVEYNCKFIVKRASNGIYWCLQLDFSSEF